MFGFRFVMVLFVIAMTFSFAQAQTTEYNLSDPTPLTRGEFNQFMTIYNPDMDALYNFKDNVESGRYSNNSKDKLDIELGENGTLAMSNVSFENKDVTIRGNGAHLAIDSKGKTSTDSVAPESGASANSVIGTPLSFTSNHVATKPAFSARQVSAQEFQAPGYKPAPANVPVLTDEQYGNLLNTWQQNAAIGARQDGITGDYDQDGSFVPSQRGSLGGWVEKMPDGSVSFTEYQQENQ